MLFNAYHHNKGAIMSLPGSASGTALVQMVESRVRQSTYGRIRNLVVEEVSGQVVVSGQVPSRHTKQLALHGALELLTSERFCEHITVV